MDEFLTTEQVAQELKVTSRTVRNLCTEGKIQYRQLTPRRIEIRRDWLEDYIDKNTFKPDQ